MPLVTAFAFGMHGGYKISGAPAVNTSVAIDASDKCLVAWLATIPPRHELVIRMALNGHAKNRGRGRDQRVDDLMHLCKIDTTAKMAKLLTEVREQGRVIEAWAAGDDG